MFNGYGASHGPVRPMIWTLASDFGPEGVSQEYIFDAIGGFWRRDTARDFSYSDGDEVEERILAIMRSSLDRSSKSLELQKAITDWPTNYHFNSCRANLLRPVRHLLKGQILEIGAGAGAITRFLGECGAQVVAVEGSERRASIVASRCADLSNVSVIADDFAVFQTGARFDVVTLIGVLEYARLFFKVGTGDPVDALIVKARGFLRPGGILIVAIENQLGLKYFAGCAEDHLGQAMVGIEDRYGDDLWSPSAGWNSRSALPLAVCHSNNGGSLYLTTKCPFLSSLTGRSSMVPICRRCSARPFGKTRSFPIRWPSHWSRLGGRFSATALLPISQTPFWCFAQMRRWLRTMCWLRITATCGDRNS